MEKTKKDKKGSLNINTGSVTLSGNSMTFNGATTTTNAFVITYTKKVESTRFIENDRGNYFEVISEEVPSGYITHGYITTTTPGRSMIKDIYGIKDGKIQIINTIRGTEQPGYYVEPDIEWLE